MTFSMLALFLAGVLVVGLVLQFGALRGLAGFRSNERKAGHYRADGGHGRSTKLPMSGGPALLATLAAGLVGMRFLFPEAGEVWRPAVAVAAFGFVGLLDDALKWRGRGLAPRWRFVGCVLAAFAGAVPFTDMTGDVATWLQLPGPAALLFLTAIGCDFSDGIDGLAATLGVITAASLGIAAALMAMASGVWVFGLLASATLAFYVFNRPSAWTKTGTIPRKAKAYLGDSGALALGGGLAATALYVEISPLFLPAAGLFLLNALAAAWQAEVLTKLVYRPHGRVLIYGKQWAPHIEFPLPLLAAPLHHHFELAGWTRVSIVRVFATVGAVMGLGTLAVAWALLQTTGERFEWWYIIAGTVAGYGLAVLAALALWRMVTLNSTFFLALDHGTIALCAGVPFTLNGRPYFRPVRETSLKATDLTSDERLWLYRPMPRPDAIEVAVRLLSAHEMKEEATAMAGMLPEAARKVRLADLEPEPK